MRFMRGNIAAVETDPLSREDNMRIDIYHHFDAEITMDKKLDKILVMLGIVQGKEDELMADLTALTAQVAQNTTVEQSAVTLIQGLAAQIAAAGTDPAALQALQDQLKVSADALAAAVAANTH
jgi:hypothetical protein